MRNLKPYDQHLSESSDFSYLEQHLYVVHLSTRKKSQMFVFTDEADAESMEQDLISENPYIEESRRKAIWECAANADIDVPDAIQRAWDEEEGIDDDDLDLAYQQLSRQDRAVVDELATTLAVKKGDQEGTYSVWIADETMGTMLEWLREVADKAKSMDEVLDWFGGGLDWVPEDLGLVERIRKQFRSRSAFGRF
jgi:hypothetical protein